MLDALGPRVPSATTTPRTGPVQAFRETRLDPALRIPRWLGLLLGGAVALGPLVASAGRAASPAVRALRGILATSAAGYVICTGLDTAEHFRLEKELTGRHLRWKAVPLDESLLHAGIILDVLAVVATARRPRRMVRRRDRLTLLAPAAFLAIGWLDEVVYHRRRVPIREEMIHATQHVSEGMMWTALYALRFLES